MTIAGPMGPIGSTSKIQRQVVITDFFRRVRTGRGFGEITNGVVPYVIKDGETPEKIAHEFYGSAYYHWVILLVNDIVNVREEWPMDNEEFNEYLADNYDNVNAVHHYIDPATLFEVDSNFAGAVPVTVIEYEEGINNDKRNIKMLDSQYLQQFVSIFDTLIIK
jgi:hypothetical protein